MHIPFFSTRWLVAALCSCASLWSCQLPGEELPTTEPENVGVSSEKVAELSKFMQSLVDEGKIAGGVTMMAGFGKVIHLKAVGMADRETGKAMQVDSIFRIASMTKPITSVAVMKLWEEKKIDLDDPVSKYIPEFKNPQVLVSADPFVVRPAKREITIRHLLTHTSGLGYINTKTIGPIYAKHGVHSGSRISDVTLEQHIRTLAEMPLLFDPGERWEYGMSTDVLGRVIEVASGMRLDDFLRSKIFVPLQMNDTYFKVPAEKLPRLASAYISVDKCIRKVEEGEIIQHFCDDGRVPLSSDYSYLDTNKYLSGGTGLCSTASDYMRFCQMLLNKGTLGDVRLLNTDTVETMTTNQIGELTIPGSENKFGFGFGILPQNNQVNEQLRGSYTWGGLWSTYFHVSPRSGWVVIALAQLAWDNEATPAWERQYLSIAVKAIADSPFATRSSWRIRPMPQEREQITFRRTFTPMDNGWDAKEAWVNRGEGEFRRQTAEKEVQFLSKMFAWSLGI